MRGRTPIFWITRPAEDSAHTAANIEHLGARVIASPVMRIEPLATTPVTTCEQVIITSKYACAAMQGIALTTSVWAVGDKVAACVRDLGFSDIHSFAKARYMLQAFARAVKIPSEVVYLRGETVRMDITAILRAQHYRVSEQTCYRTVGETALAAPLISALKHPESIYVMLYAAQAARYVRDALRANGQEAALPQLHALCISEDVAEAAAQMGFIHRSISSHPDGAGMQMLAHAQIAAKL